MTSTPLAEAASPSAALAPGAAAVPTDRQFWSLAALHAAISTIAPMLGFLTMPRDTIEGFLWGRTFQWGFFKHPPLQAWVLGLSEYLAPSAPWLAYAYGQVCVLVTLWAVWRLARSVVGASQATVVGLLTLGGIHYYGPPMQTFTPDTLSAPLWALAGLFWWRAVFERRPLAWFALAVTVALSIYAKYVGLLLVGVLVPLTLLLPEGRQAMARREFWLSLPLGLALVAPHALWVAETGFSSVDYVMSHGSSAPGLMARIGYCLSFFGAQVAAQAMLFVLFVACIGVGRFRPPVECVVEGRTVPAREKAAILAMALAPLAITLITNFVVGGEFRQGRGTALFAFSALALVMLAGPVLRLGRLRFATVAILAVAVALPVINPAHHVVRLAMGASHVPTLYPARALTEELVDIWRTRTGEPLTLVVGDRWHAGNIAFYAPGRPLILLDGDLSISPWVDREMIAREGALLVWNPADAGAEAQLRRLFPNLKADGIVSRPYPLVPGTVARLAYHIVPPAADPEETAAP